jgi:hypothetical protein
MAVHKRNVQRLRDLRRGGQRYWLTPDGEPVVRVFTEGRSCRLPEMLEGVPYTQMSGRFARAGQSQSGMGARLGSGGRSPCRSVFDRSSCHLPARERGLDGTDVYI